MVMKSQMTVLYADPSVPVAEQPAEKNNKALSFQETQPIDLHQLVNQLIKALLPLSVKQKSLMLNDIDPEFTIRTDEHKLAFVLWNLLNNTIVKNQCNCIHIEATMVYGSALIRLKDCGAFTAHYDEYSFAQVLNIIEKMGGYIGFNRNPGKGTTVTIGLSCSAAVA